MIQRYLNVLMAIQVNLVMNVLNIINIKSEGLVLQHHTKLQSFYGRHFLRKSCFLWHQKDKIVIL